MTTRVEYCLFHSMWTGVCMYICMLSAVRTFIQRHRPKPKILFLTRTTPWSHDNGSRSLSLSLPRDPKGVPMQSQYTYLTVHTDPYTNEGNARQTDDESPTPPDMLRSILMFFFLSLRRKDSFISDEIRMRSGCRHRFR